MRTKKTTKKSAKSKKMTKQPTKNTDKKSGFLKDEIMILILLAVCILLLLSNFGIGGFVGNAISSLMFGIFGFIAYIFPFIVFLGISIFVLNRNNSLTYVKIGAGTVLTLMLSTFIQLVKTPHGIEESIFEYYKLSSTQKNGGGLIGGFFVEILSPSAGVAGAVVIVIALILISLVIITEKSLLRGVKKGGAKAIIAAKENVHAHKVNAQIRREKKRKTEEEYLMDSMDEVLELSQDEPDVKGVSFDSGLNVKKPDMKDLFKVSFEKPKRLLKGTASMEEGEDFYKENQEPELTINRMEDPSASRKKQKVKVDVEEETGKVEEMIQNNMSEKSEYQIPPVTFLKEGVSRNGDSESDLKETAMKLQNTLENFGVNARVNNISCGPSVTRFEIQPEMGVKVAKILSLQDDIKLNLAVEDIRIEAPIPGKAAVGIEVPNKEMVPVMIRDLIESEEFQSAKSKLTFAVGRDIGGKVVVADIQKMPHLLIAGATGSGKSVCINTLIMSILYKATPDEVKLIMIDPKVVELSVYNGIPHLMIPVVVDPKKAAGALNWAVAEMEKRYKLFAGANVRDLKGYNEKAEERKDLPEEERMEHLPQIVIIVDELADLMMVSPTEVETAICRLAQLARAAGIHLVLATQRPSVNVITGLIKANMPSRIAFAVSAGVDSRTIIDSNGAEKLLGKGDMLFYPQEYTKPARVQGAFVSDREVQSVVNFLLQSNGDVEYNKEMEDHVNSITESGSGSGYGTKEENEKDEYFYDAARFVIEKNKASIGMLQRVFKIGFNRAARIMDQLHEIGVVGEEEGTKPRKVLVTLEEFENYINENE